MLAGLLIGCIILLLAYAKLEQRNRPPPMRVYQPERVDWRSCLDAAVANVDLTTTNTLVAAPPKDCLKPGDVPPAYREALKQ